MSGHGDISRAVRDMTTRPMTEEQISRIGQEMGKFMPSDLLELCLDAMTSMGSSIGNYREDLGERVQRYIVVEELEDEAGYLEVEVRFTGWSEPDKRFRIHVSIEEMET